MTDKEDAARARELLQRVRAEHRRLREEGWLHGAIDPVHAEIDAFLGDGGIGDTSESAAALKQAQDIAAAWKALAKAERAWHSQTELLDGHRDHDMKGANGDVELARERLRDLGVDPVAAIGQ